MVQNQWNPLQLGCLKKMHFDKEECDFISRYISTIGHYDITYLAEVIPPTCDVIGAAACLQFEHII